MHVAQGQRKTRAASNRVKAAMSCRVAVAQNIRQHKLAGTLTNSQWHQRQRQLQQECGHNNNSGKSKSNKSGMQQGYTA